jgi:hypothetical protein
MLRPPGREKWDEGPPQSGEGARREGRKTRGEGNHPELTSVLFIVSRVRFGANQFRKPSLCSIMTRSPMRVCRRRAAL